MAIKKISEEMGLIIFNNNSYSQNSYIYFNKKYDAVIIDPGLSERELVRSIIDSYNVKAIILTHGHFDHIFALEKVKGITQAPVYVYIDEKELLETPALNMSASKSEAGKELFGNADIFVKDADSIKIGDDFDFFVIHTPGHTAGGMCLYDKQNNILFSGDTLFRESVGRTDLPTGNQRALIDSISNKLFTLPDSTIVHSGHGKPTTIIHEKNNNPYV